MKVKADKELLDKVGDDGFPRRKRRSRSSGTLHIRMPHAPHGLSSDSSVLCTTGDMAKKKRKKKSKGRRMVELFLNVMKSSPARCHVDGEIVCCIALLYYTIMIDIRGGDRS